MTGGKDILFEKFEIIECLKKDVGSCVYIAHHIYLGKKILLKTLDRSKIADPAMLKRFQREAKTLARLNHENIIIVHDFGTFDSFFYISFEYFPGGNLRDVIEANDRSPEQKQHIFAQILNGVAFAHKHKIIHRDLKPENILVNDRNQVKVADFGLALIEGEESLTAQTSIVGTPSYMSPEQIRGESLTPQSDLFSLGVIGYELFTGKNPFLGKDAGATLHNILAPQTRLDSLTDVPSPFADLFQAMLKKNKNERLQSAGEALARLAIKDETEAPAIPVASRPIKWRRYLFPAAALLALTVVFIFRRELIGTKQNADKHSLQTDSSLVAKKNIIRSALQQQERTTEPAPVKPESSIVSPAQRNTTTGRLLIKCSPWAHVFVDSNKVDTTPMEEAVTLPVGEHELVLEHPNFPAYMKKIRIMPADELILAVDLDTLFGYCNIYPWGNVYIDGELEGQTPLADAIVVTPGKHTLVVKNQRYKSVLDSFFVARLDTFYYQYNFDDKQHNSGAVP